MSARHKITAMTIIIIIILKPLLLDGLDTIPKALFIGCVVADLLYNNMDDLVGMRLWVGNVVRK